MNVINLQVLLDTNTIYILQKSIFTFVKIHVLRKKKVTKAIKLERFIQLFSFIYSPDTIFLILAFLSKQQRAFSTIWQKLAAKGLSHLVKFHEARVFRYAISARRLLS